MMAWARNLISNSLISVSPTLEKTKRYNKWILSKVKANNLHIYIGDGSITYTLVHQCLNNRKHISTTKEPTIVSKS
jgi:hypothetical protein